MSGPKWVTEEIKNAKRAVIACLALQSEARASLDSARRAVESAAGKLALAFHKLEQAENNAPKVEDT